MNKAKNSKTAEITIYSTQHDISDETTETLYTGEYRFLADTHVISYEEFFQEEGNPPAKTTTLIKIGEDFIHIAKKGAITTQMHFEPLKAYHGSYQTPFGTFALLIDTKHLAVCEQENEVQADIKYYLSLNNCPVSRCIIRIQIKIEKKKK